MVFYLLKDNLNELVNLTYHNYIDWDICYDNNLSLRIYIV